MRPCSCRCREVSARRQLFTLDRAHRGASPAMPTRSHGRPAARCASHWPGTAAANACCSRASFRRVQRTTHVSAAVSTSGSRCSIPIVAQQLLDTLAEGDLRSRLALLQLDAVRATQPARQLSGGERLSRARVRCGAARPRNCCCSTSRPITSISNRCGRSKPRWRDSPARSWSPHDPRFAALDRRTRCNGIATDGATNPSRD